MPNINYPLGDEIVVVALTEQPNYTPCIGAIQRLPWGGATGAEGQVLPQPPANTPTIVLRCEITEEYQAIVKRHRETSGENINREIADNYAHQKWANSQYIGEVYCNHFEIQCRYRVM